MIIECIAKIRTITVCTCGYWYDHHVVCAALEKVSSRIKFAVKKGGNLFTAHDIFAMLCK